jgi:hypothetical protein
MPLHFRKIDDQGQYSCVEIPLTSEMPEADFSWPGKFNWYYDTFAISALMVYEDEAYNQMKRDLADWLNDPVNMGGPFYIMEGSTQGHGGMREELMVVVLDPNDILSFQNRWAEHFQFDKESAQKNLRMDISRIEKGYTPADQRLRDVYARYASVYPAPTTDEEKQANLIRSFATPTPL